MRRRQRNDWGDNAGEVSSEEERNAAQQQFWTVIFLGLIACTSLSACTLAYFQVSRSVGRLNMTAVTLGNGGGDPAAAPCGMGPMADPMAPPLPVKKRAAKLKKKRGLFFSGMSSPQMMFAIMFIGTPFAITFSAGFLAGRRWSRR